MYKLSRPNISNDEIQAVSRVLESGNLVYGTKGIEFEAELASFLHTDSVSVVSSGTAVQKHRRSQRRSVGNGFIG